MSQANERPILFGGPMVRAILSGQKTVTRRVVKPQFVRAPVDVVDGVPSWDHPATYAGEVMMNTERGKPCPYGKPGDRLWVRETWLEDPEDDGSWGYTQYMGCKGSPLSDIPKRFQKPEHCLYRAGWGGSAVTWRPSIHMPRWASRILLEITDVRVERLRDADEMTLLDDLGDELDDCDSVAGREFSRMECIQVAGAPLKMIPEMYGFKARWDKTNGPGSFD